MDGIKEPEELSRPPRLFTAAEKKLVQTLRKEGKPNPEIAKRIGVTTSTLLWLIKEGRFGRIESRQGQHAKGRKCHHLADDPKTGTLFGTRTWKQRQNEIKNGWSNDEATRRHQGILPGVADNYKRFRK